MLLRRLAIVACIVFFFPAISQAATTQALGTEYVSDAEELGIGIAVRPPVGWDVQDTGQTVVIHDKRGNGMRISRYGEGYGVTWNYVAKEHARFKVGQDLGGVRVLAKGKTKVAGQSALYLLGTESGYTRKLFYVAHDAQIYTLEMIVAEDEWEATKPLLEKSLASVRLLSHKAVSASTVPKKLGDSLIMTGGKNGFDFSVKPPAGWKVETDRGGVSIYPVTVQDKYVITISREEDTYNEWEMQQKVFGAFSERELTKVLANVVSEVLDEDVKVVKAKPNIVINGDSRGWSAEFSRPFFAGATVYGKMYTFKHGEYVYRVVVGTVGEDDRDWKKYRGILEKSAQSFRVLE